MAELIELEELEERVILVAVSTSEEDDTEESLDEPVSYTHLDVYKRQEWKLK